MAATPYFRGMPTTRRRFLASAGTLVAGSPLLPHTLDGLTRPASDRLRIGLIGAKGMGWSNLQAQLAVDDDTELAWLCDVDESVLSDRLGDYAALRRNTPRTTGDYRELLDDPEVDVVIIGTPDHWHARMFVDAVDAGKDVYVEKPIANSVEECRAMVAAQERTGRVVQVGQWQRSGEHYARAIEIVRSGELGRIRLVKCWAYQAWMEPVPPQPDQAPPPGVDYAMWLGPAPSRPFNPNRFHFTFRWFWDYAGGLMTDWGVHQLDIALLAMGADAPRSVMASGGKFAYPDDASETPDTLQTVYDFGDYSVMWEHAVGIDLGPDRKSEGIAFVGNLATLVLNRGGFEVVPEREFVGWGEEGPQKRAPAFGSVPEGVDYVQEHNRNFLRCVRDRTPEACATRIDSGAVAAVNAQLGNVAYKTGRKLYWDGDGMTGDFRDDAEASALLRASYHNGWEVPTG